ncbi:MAG: hypothetical protein JST92_20635 [Deltaproteobacteria bacterium]|nr:hypothetical protein [Deltaproteobacteria bacterium]
MASQTAPVLLKTAPLLLLDGSLVYDPSGKTAGGELRFGVRALRFDGDGLVLSAGVAVARKPGLVGQASWTLFASASEDSEDSHRRFFLDALLRGRLAPIDGGLALGGGGGVQLHGWLGGPMSWLLAASFEGVHGPSGTIFTPLVLLGLRVDL